MKGVILSSKLIESTLKAQFGEILPIELPIQNRPLISHQIESLKKFCETIYITIPKGYNIDITSSIPRLELELNLSLIQVLDKISEFFDLNERIFIYYGDSLLLNIGSIETSKNYFFVQKPIHQYLWGASNNNGMVPAGGVIISVFELKLLLKNCNNFNEFVENITQNMNIIMYSNFEWLDFGHTLTYYNSRKRFLEARSFNKLKHKDGYIIKSSKDILKIWSEFNWLKICKEKFPTNIPFVTDFNINNNEANYSIEYINHPPLSDIFVFGKISESYFIKILESIKNTVLKIRNQEFKQINIFSSNFMVDKLVNRKEDILKLVKKLNSNVEYVEDMINENVEYFSKKEFDIVPIHGDLCFSNILFDFSIFEPILIDPRGYVSLEDGFSMYGPSSYDYYKLAHSFILGYDYIIAGKVSDTFFSNIEINKRLNIFCELFDIEKTDLLMGLKNLFLSMLPLHSDSIIRQKSFINILYKIEEL
jgi:hypothetical protein